MPRRDTGGGGGSGSGGGGGTGTLPPPEIPAVATQEQRLRIEEARATVQVFRLDSTDAFGVSFLKFSGVGVESVERDDIEDWVLVKVTAAREVYQAFGTRLVTFT